MFKELKIRGLKKLKNNYLFLVLLCLIAAFISIEFIGSLIFTNRFTKKFNNQKFLINDFIKINKDKEIFIPKDTIDVTMHDVFSGTITYKMYEAFRSTIKTNNKYIIPFIFISIIIVLMIWFIFVNPYMIIMRRFFLENRIYRKLSKERFLYLFKSKSMIKSSFTLLMKNIHLFFWMFTIVGYFIKRYAYFLVPYIVSENPKIKWNDALKLSEDMMKGHKLECFKIEISFLGWHILGVFTLGISKVLFSNVYEMTTFAEYYADIRKISKNNKIDNSDLLCDYYLFEKVPNDIIEKYYSDIVEYNKMIKRKFNISKFKLFLLKNFGISLVDKELLDEYNKNLYYKIKIKEYKNEMNGLAYPTRLFIIPENQKRKYFSTRNYLECYNILSLIGMFLLFSIVGWIWEVILRFIEQGIFVNKGALHGPWLPIYGRGIILILILLYRFRSNPTKEFFLIVLLCGVVEYFTGLYLELTHDGQRWWDYSGYFLNLHGRICAEGLLIFGLGGLLAIYLVAPLIYGLLKKIPKMLFIIVCIILYGCFIFDEIYSSFYPNMAASINPEEYEKCKINT